jgi:hypothetical protein
MLAVFFPQSTGGILVVSKSYFFTGYEIFQNEFALSVEFSSQFNKYS